MDMSGAGMGPVPQGPRMHGGMDAGPVGDVGILDLQLVKAKVDNVNHKRAKAHQQAETMQQLESCILQSWSELQKLEQRHTREEATIEKEINDVILQMEVDRRIHREAVQRLQMGIREVVMAMENYIPPQRLASLRGIPDLNVEALVHRALSESGGPPLQQQQPAPCAMLGPGAAGTDVAAALGPLRAAGQQTGARGPGSELEDMINRLSAPSSGAAGGPPPQEPAGQGAGSNADDDFIAQMRMLLGSSEPQAAGDGAAGAAEAPAAAPAAGGGGSQDTSLLEQLLLGMPSAAAAAGGNQGDGAAAAEQRAGSEASPRQQDSGAAAPAAAQGEAAPQA
eukprot:TRINITY_DN55540_c0_g1_i1.p1 TRINITY_DN55540_c0_g1~~TRINITY_DN55540_c0_g1_i1.p1  ORF type:complete len:338 (+),score=97.51 TRINITY_DN55540_c0_g1_i1:117-1130(+)